MGKLQWWGEREGGRDGQMDVIKITFGTTCLKRERRYTKKLKQQIHTKSFSFPFHTLSLLINKINDFTKFCLDKQLPIINPTTQEAETDVSQ